MTDPRLANLLGVTALAAADRLRAAVEAEMRHGGSAPAALVHLQAYPGQPAEALRVVLGISQPAVARLIERLEAEGLIERGPGLDRRSRSLTLTAAGDRAATELLERRTASLSEMLDTLSPRQRDALSPLLEQLVASLAGDRPSAVHVCRMCDRGACTSGPGCPLDHTVDP